MEPFKILSLRLPAELLEQVDEHAERVGGDANRSFVLRSLIEAGLEKTRLEVRISEMEGSISRLMHVVEKSYLMGYMGARILNDANEVTKEKRDEITDEASRLLVKTLVEKFGY
jgi:Arc/MetJ-type ribon-helix-helix transcriptional regulator